MHAPCCFPPTMCHVVSVGAMGGGMLGPQPHNAHTLLFPSNHVPWVPLVVSVGAMGGGVPGFQPYNTSALLFPSNHVSWVLLWFQ